MFASLKDMLNYYQANNIGMTSTKLTRTAPTVGIISSDVINLIDPITMSCVTTNFNTDKMIKLVEDILLNPEILKIFEKFGLEKNVVNMSIKHWVNLFFGCGG